MSRHYPFLLVLVTLVLLLAPAQADGQDPGGTDPKSDAAALANYADAANFQTNGAIDLAIQSWREFLKKFPQDKLAPKAAHYLGVCYMTAEPPDLTQAATAFATALQTENFELREESLSNRAWCLYASATEGDQPDESLLKESLKTYQQFLQEFPKSAYLDRAFFYSGESAYALGELKPAIDYYSELLQLDNAAKSPLRCDALYARGIAQEENDDNTAAAKSYEQLLQACIESEFVVDVQLRLADLQILDKRYDDAIALLHQVIDEAAGLATDDDRALATFRLAFCHAKQNQPVEAAKHYQQLIEKYPQSRFAAASRLAAAQSLYQAGQTQPAAEAFRIVLAGQDPVAATEAAHWLARIDIAKAASLPAGSPEMKAAAASAYLVASERLKLGAQGEYSVALQYDAAEALAFEKDRLDEALAAFEAFAREHADSPLAPRAIYSAAYTALQLAQYERATELAEDFAKRFPDNPLIPDAASVGAEAKRLAGVAADRARYQLAQAASDDGDYAAAVEQFDLLIESGRDPALTPFALYGKGWAQMSVHDDASAVAALSRVIDEFPQHPIFDDALLARGITLRNLKQYDQAASDFLRFLETKPTGVRLGHALYELALVRQNQGQPAQAATHLSELVKQVPDYPGMDKVLYELGWSLKEAGQAEAAITQFQTLIAKYPDNAVVQEAAYFVGQSQYKNEQWADAAISFATAAAAEPKDGEVDNDLLEKSLYRLGWSLFKVGDYPGAEAAFVRQYESAPSGTLSLDAMMMVGESRFKQSQFDQAFQAYQRARERIVANNDSANTVRDDADRQVRELTLLHGGQSAAQLKDWTTAIDWYDELRQRFPATTYLPQVFYETGYAYEQEGDEEKALQLYGQVADSYRNEVAARARFMRGEIYFAQKEYALAIPEFQRVMYGFGADQAAADVKNWQAKSGFEAGRCAESLFDVAKTDAAKEKARGFAVRFYQYVVDQHASHELASKSKERLQAIKG